MLEFIYMACLLLANVHPSQLEQKDSKEDEVVQDDSTKEKEGDIPNTVFPCSKIMSQPTIDSPTQEATIGWNVTLECVSQNGSLPIRYVLYKGKNKTLDTVTKYNAGEKALFNFVINSDDDLGEYKCKAANKCSTKYSSSFYFKDMPHTVFPCSKIMSQPTIDSPTQEATIGWNVTLECVSQNGSLPIRYMLYKGKNKTLDTVTKYNAGEKALFNFVINSDDDLGEYKCKAANKCSTKYSSGFYFKAPKDNTMMFIVAPLLVTVLAVTVLLLVLWCRARKSKLTSSHTGSGSTTYPASENCTTYEKIAYENEDVAYIEVKFDTKDEDYRKMFSNFSSEVDTTVNYAEVAIRK